MRGFQPDEVVAGGSILSHHQMLAYCWHSPGPIGQGLGQTGNNVVFSGSLGVFVDPVSLTQGTTNMTNAITNPDTLVRFCSMLAQICDPAIIVPNVCVN